MNLSGWIKFHAVCLAMMTIHLLTFGYFGFIVIARCEDTGEVVRVLDVDGWGGGI